MLFRNVLGENEKCILFLFKNQRKFLANPYLINPKQVRKRQNKNKEKRNRGKTNSKMVGINLTISVITLNAYCETERLNDRMFDCKTQLYMLSAKDSRVVALDSRRK